MAARMRVHAAAASGDRPPLQTCASPAQPQQMWTIVGQTGAQPENPDAPDGPNNPLRPTPHTAEQALQQAQMLVLRLPGWMFTMNAGSLGDLRNDTDECRAVSLLLQTLFEAGNVREDLSTGTPRYVPNLSQFGTPSTSVYVEVLPQQTTTGAPARPDVVFYFVSRSASLLWYSMIDTVLENHRNPPYGRRGGERSDFERLTEWKQVIELIKTYLALPAGDERTEHHALFERLMHSTAFGQTLDSPYTLVRLLSIETAIQHRIGDPRNSHVTPWAPQNYLVTAPHHGRHDHYDVFTHFPPTVLEIFASDAHWSVLSQRSFDLGDPDGLEHLWRLIHSFDGDEQERDGAVLGAVLAHLLGPAEQPHEDEEYHRRRRDLSELARRSALVRHAVETIEREQRRIDVLYDIEQSLGELESRIHNTTSTFEEMTDMCHLRRRVAERSFIDEVWPGTSERLSPAQREQLAEIHKVLAEQAIDPSAPACPRAYQRRVSADTLALSELGQILAADYDELKDCAQQHSVVSFAYNMLAAVGTHDFNFNMLLLGDAAVGKSWLVKWLKRSLVGIASETRSTSLAATAPGNFNGAVMLKEEAEARNLGIATVDSGLSTGDPIVKAMATDSVVITKAMFIEPETGARKLKTYLALRNNNSLSCANEPLKDVARAMRSRFIVVNVAANARAGHKPAHFIGSKFRQSGTSADFAARKRLEFALIRLVYMLRQTGNVSINMDAAEHQLQALYAALASYGHRTSDVRRQTIVHSLCEVLVIRRALHHLFFSELSFYARPGVRFDIGEFIARIGPLLHSDAEAAVIAFEMCAAQFVDPLTVDVGVALAALAKYGVLRNRSPIPGVYVSFGETYPRIPGAPPGPDGDVPRDYNYVMFSGSLSEAAARIHSGDRNPAGYAQTDIYTHLGYLQHERNISVVPRTGPRIAAVDVAKVFLPVIRTVSNQGVREVWVLAEYLENCIESIGKDYISLSVQRCMRANMAVVDSLSPRPSVGLPHILPALPLRPNKDAPESLRYHWRPDGTTEIDGRTDWTTFRSQSNAALRDVDDPDAVGFDVHCAFGGYVDGDRLVGDLVDLYVHNRARRARAAGMVVLAARGEMTPPIEMTGDAAVDIEACARWLRTNMLEMVYPFNRVHEYVERLMGVEDKLSAAAEGFTSASAGIIEQFNERSSYAIYRTSERLPQKLTAPPGKRNTAICMTIRAGSRWSIKRLEVEPVTTAPSVAAAAAAAADTPPAEPRRPARPGSVLYPIGVKRPAAAAGPTGAAAAAAAAAARPSAKRARPFDEPLNEPPAKRARPNISVTQPTFTDTRTSAGSGIDSPDIGLRSPSIDSRTMHEFPPMSR